MSVSSAAANSAITSTREDGVVPHPVRHRVAHRHPSWSACRVFQRHGGPTQFVHRSVGDRDRHDGADSLGREYVTAADGRTVSMSSRS